MWKISLLRILMLHLVLRIYAHQGNRLLISIDRHILERIYCCLRKLFIENYTVKGRKKRNCLLLFMSFFSLDGKREPQRRNLLREEVLRKGSGSSDRVSLHGFYSTSIDLDITRKGLDERIKMVDLGHKQEY